MTHVHGVDDGVGYGVLGESAHGFGVYGYSDNGLWYIWQQHN